MVVRRLFGRRRGVVSILVAVSMIAVLGMVALAMDGGMLQDQRRRTQAAADAAAMAAAVDLYGNYITYSGVDTPTASAAAAAQAAADKLGYTNDGTYSTVTINIPPVNGPHAGQKGYVEVLIQCNQPRGFSRLFGESNMHIRARAVARGRWEPFRNGILVLDTSVSEALKTNGTGGVTVNGADIIVNSSDTEAVGSDGAGSIITVLNGALDLTGGLKANTTVVGTINYDQEPTPDPLAYLPYPAKPPNANNTNPTPANSSDARTYLNALNINPQDVNGKVYILDPGRYDKMPPFGNGDVVILKQGGIYYLDDCGFSSTGATIVMDPTGATTGGVMFYNDPIRNSSGISITGGIVDIGPLTSGIYKGISIFQRRDANVDLSITGQGSMKFRGTFYVAGGAIKTTGSDSTGLDVIGSQYISRTLQVGGNGKYNVTWKVDDTARLRQLQLVE